MLRAAALRLSRLVNRLFPRAGELTPAKIPQLLRDPLRHHVAQGALVSSPGPACQA